MSKQELAGRITNALCVIEREPGGHEVLRGIDVTLSGLFTETELEGEG